MIKPIRLVCGDCLRSVEIGSGEFSESPSVCQSCGGTLREPPEPRFFSTVDQQTPVSLELSPDFIGPWTDDPAEAPDRLGRFQVRDQIGGGGFGLVFRAHDPRLCRDVALKVLKESQPSPRVIERFFREARAAAQLDHPNVVPLHDAGRDAGRCWIAYQFVPGKTLAQLAETGPIGAVRAVRIVRDLADAIHHAHQHGVYHRDVKPANVIVDLSGRPRLTDFGLARRVDLDPTLTRDGTVLGTPAYMSPEQAAGNSHQADARSDIYSLAVVLHELLCGHRPADLPGSNSTTSWTTTAGSPLPLTIRPSRMPRGLFQVCRKALAADPNHRYADARGLADDLDRWLDHRRTLPGRLRVLGLAVALVAACVAIPRRSPTAAMAAVSGNSKPNPVASASNAARPAIKAGEEPFIGNKDTRVVHPSGCRHIVSLRRDHAIGFASEEEALGQGYRPCLLNSKVVSAR